MGTFVGTTSLRWQTRDWFELVGWLRGFWRLAIRDLFGLGVICRGLLGGLWHRTFESRQLRHRQPCVLEIIAVGVHIVDCGDGVESQ